MASYPKWQLYILSALLLQEVSNAFRIVHQPHFYNDNETINHPEIKCSGLTKRFEHKLGKFRNFYANLLQEDNENFEVEIQELYTIISLALDETNEGEKERMLCYSVILIDTTRDLEVFLQTRGINNI